MNFLLTLLKPFIGTAAHSLVTTVDADKAQIEASATAAGTNALAVAVAKIKGEEAPVVAKYPLLALALPMLNSALDAEVAKLSAQAGVSADQVLEKLDAELHAFAAEVGG